MIQLKPEQRERFDRLLQQVLEDLPADLSARFDEIPLVVEDYPPESMLRKLRVRRPEFLLGLHTGIPLTRRSVRHSGALPTVITIYRLGIFHAAGDEIGQVRDDTLSLTIRNTIFHELGHHFGMGEADLRRYGY